MSSKSVIVIGGGLAGLSSAVALADAGLRVKLLEQKPYLGGRASSFGLPGGEHVDNCQHVTMGCCTNLSDFYERVGASGKIAWHKRLVFVDALGRRGIMEASSLPAPMHLSGSLLFYPSLNWTEKREICRAMLAIARLGGMNKNAGGEGASMLDWLRRQGQSDRAIAHFWAVVLVSALNEELDRIDARYGLDVFWKAFLANREGYVVGLPRVPLGDLYDGCRGAIERRGGDVALRATVSGMHLSDGRVCSVEMRDGASEKADYYILAVPHASALELMPKEAVECDAGLRNIRRLRDVPITSVHFWFDRDVMVEPFLTLLDRTTQWIFNKSLLSGGQGIGRYVQCVISASYSLVPLSRQQIIETCLREVREVVPEARRSKLLKATVIKETHATFSPEPGSDRWRPKQRTGVTNLFLAGDWTDTGWPATMEGAVRSGYLAAEAILADAGIAQKLLRADLPPEGLARVWASR